MHYTQLFVLVTLATFAAVTTVVAAVLVVTWRYRGAALSTSAGVSRARVFLLLRIAPVLSGALACAVMMLAFVRYEPLSTTEAPGWMLLISASVGAALFLGGSARAAIQCWRTGRFLRALERSATPVEFPGIDLPAWRVDTTLPLVGLAGIWRPRLLLAAGVLDRVPDDELQVIVEHELAHARRRDNVVRLVFTALPDIVGWVERRVGIERAWHEAAEDAADDAATGSDPAARVCLASALVRVARMADSHVMPAVPLLAFYSGGSIERRVRRLVEPVGSQGCRSSSVRRVLLLAAGTALISLGLTADGPLLSVHRAIEWMVNLRV
jgi:hypothetical protein